MGSVSNYFHVSLQAFFRTLEELCQEMIRWSDEADREKMEEMLILFPYCVFCLTVTNRVYEVPTIKWSRIGHSMDTKREIVGTFSCFVTCLIVE